MPHFPVINSTLSPQFLAKFLHEKYTLSEHTECKLIKAGINDTYLVIDSEVKFVFRIYSYNWRTPIEIHEEINLLNELKQNQIAVSYPISDKSNNYIQTLNAPEGDRYAVLFSFAEGEKLHLLSEDGHFKIGALMARLHAVTLNKNINRVSYTPQVILIDSLKQLHPFLPDETEEMQFMQTTQKHLLDAFQKVNISDMRNGIVHLDIWFDNLNIQPNNEVTIFDFDFCGNGWLAFDIAYYIMQLHNVERYEAKDYQPKVDSFLKGYESITPISKEEKRMLPMLGVSLYFFYLGIQCQRYDNWSNSFLSENYLKRFINGLVKKYCEIHGIGSMHQ